MFIYLFSILKHKLIISHPAGVFGSPSSRFTVKDYRSLKTGTGSKQCVAMKNGDASQTRWSSHTETRCTSVGDLTKYTHAIRHSKYVSHDSLGAIALDAACLVNVSSVEEVGGEMVLNPAERHSSSQLHLVLKSKCLSEWG